MISKLAKAHESWTFKIISVAVAASFVSLFGVTGYISSASQNQTVIKVGKEKITQSEFMYQNQREISALKKFAGDDMEISDELRASISEGVIKQMINDSVLDQVMRDNAIYFPKAFLQQAIFSQPEFRNPEDGHFNKEIFKRYLDNANMTEDEYVNVIKRLIAERMLVDGVIGKVNVPMVLSRATHNMDNQRKIFKYLTLSPEDVKIERKISEDEVAQYFEDFSEQFIIPEIRDADVIFISNDSIFNKYVANEETVREYYEQNKQEFNQAEKRNVEQMVFLDQAQAEKAFEELKKGTDFAVVAKNLNADNADEPSLGLVTQDELAEDLAYDAFEIALNEPKLLKVADTWQVIKVSEIIPAKEADFNEAKPRIIEILKNDNLYDALRDVRADIDDAVNAGKTMEEISNDFGVSIVKVSDIKESVLVENMPEQIKSLNRTLDFNELVFSYGMDEITSAEEFDEGIAILKVTAIKDAHLPEVNDVRDEIIALWTVQEKDALAKEIAENIIAEVNDGSDLSVAAKARDLEVYRSEPISRNETFAALNENEVSDLFLIPNGEIKSFEHVGNKFVIVTPVESVSFNDKMDDEGLKNVQARVMFSLTNDMRKSALDSYADDYKIKVHYDMLGLVD